MATFTANYTSTIRAAAQYILSLAPVGLRAFDAEKLANMATCADDELSAYFGCEWRIELNGVQAECSLYFDLARSYTDAPKIGRAQDDDGNAWALYSPSVQVAWPSYGSTQLGGAKMRLRLMNEIAALADGLESMLRVALNGAPVALLVQTKAQREKAAAERAEKLAAGARAKAVAMLGEALVAAGACSGLRVGQERTTAVPATALAGVPFNNGLAGGPPVQLVEIQKRTFQVFALPATGETAALRVTRVA